MKKNLKQRIYSFIFCKLLRWKIVGQIDPAILKCVLMVVPHTSWQDFFIGLFSRGIINLEMHFVAKQEFFKFPIGWWFKWMGGAPIDRNKTSNHVEAIVQVFQSRNVFRMAIAPEGTRKKVQRLKSGFYYIALQAQVPIIPVAFNYGKKQVVIGQPFQPMGNYETDVAALGAHFQNVVGKFPDKSFSF